MKLPQEIFQFMAIISLQKAVEAVLCFDCHSELGTCNDGECEGSVCVKMETSNRDNDRRTVQKGCSEQYEESGCQQTSFGSKWTSRCVCDRTMCNGDAALIAAGLESSSGTTAVTSIPGAQLAVISFVFIFAAASCSLLIINTFFFHWSHTSLCLIFHHRYNWQIKVDANNRYCNRCRIT